MRKTPMLWRVCDPRRYVSPLTCGSGLHILIYHLEYQKVIKETFSLSNVPKEALYLGMAGVIPYVATSLQTVFLSYEINRAAALGDGLIFSGESAELMLHMLEPIQVGYGAVVSDPDPLYLSNQF
jgi:hypothetical protein